MSRLPSKKILSLCFSLIILAGVIYTIASNIFIVNEEEKGISSLVEEAEPLDQSAGIDAKDGTVEYRLTEEQEADDSHTEEGDHHNHEHDAQETETRTLNVRAPNFELKTLAGETVRLSDLEGKKVFINFWATWCPPCVEEMPAMQDFYDELTTKENVVILAINTTDKESNTSTVKHFVGEFGITFPILLDQEGEVLLNYEVLTLPTSIIVDEAGMVVEQILGPVTKNMLEEKLL
ncbi:peroxiredoxin family protein [Ureibacillus aquaedulcis]|uniref:Redoxin domain-containing protein n=1 Tax=Ureibacillus aquaedulcis TaxID=3058421 RepID=A0ABT8GR47_9BACL|nr:redoxin domain-containing protein [Ureibacillus sp. BA0131]MDN4493896.1 redoxin domain-containing protein [Ureibacillus sp. BA0131]